MINSSAILPTPLSESAYSSGTNTYQAADGQSFSETLSGALSAGSPTGLIPASQIPGAGGGGESSSLNPGLARLERPSGPFMISPSILPPLETYYPGGQAAAQDETAPDTEPVEEAVSAEEAEVASKGYTEWWDPWYLSNDPWWQVNNPDQAGNTYTTPVEPTTGVDDVTGVDGVPADDGEANSYSLNQVGQIDRAPMAMFEHNGELVLSAITRNGINETPIWTYSDAGGIQKRATLPEQAESGHYGYSFGDGFHLTPESSGGMIDYTASSPDGPYVKTDYTHLCPHEYKNLKWGFSYKCPETGREFMGFGNSNHNGVTITYDAAQSKWVTFAAPDDMKFPSGMGVITSGENAGSTLISSTSTGGTKLHLVDEEGNSKTVGSFSGWGLARVDHSNQVAYVTAGEKVYWASFDDLNNWQACQVEKPSGSGTTVEGIGEPNIHPQTGRMIFPAMDPDSGSTTFYEARRVDGQMVLSQVAFTDKAGQWAGKTAVVGNDFYFGSGLDNGQAADRAPGGIYKLELA